MIFFSEGSLRYAIEQYVEHYHSEQNDQGLKSQIIRPQFQKCEDEGTIERHERHERLGGLLNFTTVALRHRGNRTNWRRLESQNWNEM